MTLTLWLSSFVLWCALSIAVAAVLGQLIRDRDPNAEPPFGSLRPSRHLVGSDGHAPRSAGPRPGAA